MNHTNLKIKIPERKLPFIKIDKDGVDFCDIKTCIQRKYAIFSPTTVDKYENMNIKTYGISS